MSLRILISGSTGESMPPPYGGTQNVSLQYAKTWKKMGHDVAVTFVYKPQNADDLGANADYFFEYHNKPSKLGKFFFLTTYLFRNPFLYIFLFKRYYKIYPRLSKETFLYASYGVWMGGVIKEWKPDIITCQTTLIKSFMIGELSKKFNIPVVFESYAEIHDLNMGVNKNLNEKEREKYWKYFLSLASLTIGMDNCTIGPLMYLSPDKVKAFYDTCDYEYYQKNLNQSKEEIRKEFNLPENMFLLCMTGAYHYRKGHDSLIKAISILKKSGVREVGAVLVGGNVGQEKWVELCREEDVTDKVFFLHNLSEEKKLKLYKSTEGYCNLSNSTRSCGLDLALLEAMSCALPIVVYDNGALSNAVSENNGYVVPKGDSSAVAEAIRKLYGKTTEERLNMGEGSRKFASKTDLNVTAKIKEEWFMEVIRNYRNK